MTRYVQIAVNVAHVSGVFDYHVPVELEGMLEVGSLVAAPFGSQTVQGVVVGFVEQPAVRETKAVLELVDPQAVLTAWQIALAQHMATESLASLAACIGLMLPPGVEQQADVVYTAKGILTSGLSDPQTRLLKLLHQRGPLKGGQIDRAMRFVDWRSAARALARKGLVATQKILPQPRVRPKLVRTVQLACSHQAAEEAMPSLGRTGTPALARRQAMLRFLMGEKGAVAAAWVYAESSGGLEDLRYLSQRGLVWLGEGEAIRDPLAEYEFVPNEPPVLTRDQRSAWDEVRKCIQRAAAGERVSHILLHGVTGSGKTEIYLQAVEETIGLGRQAIVLVPEIALTPQTLRRFAGRFPGQVGLIHSGLSQGERYDTWRRARAGELSLVVGPRSALFTPFEHPGLVVVDECHDDSYYQAEAPPYYHAREAAVQYARLAGAVCLMGSATPDITSAFRCQQGEWNLLRLPLRILAHHQAVAAQIKKLNAQGKRREARRAGYQPVEAMAEAIDLPPVRIVDMREELQAGNRSIFSLALQEALGQVLEQSEQAILFLNRRGTNTYVFCRDCGTTMKCPRCEVPLTYHEARGLLICHYCNYQRKMPQKCPACGGQRIRQYGTGTQKVEAEVQALFPQARTLRWDHETTRKKGAHEAIMSHFANQRADVLVGTQMLAKGLDLPLVTLVGVVLADVGLSLPDYRTNERAFQVLTQVAGRAGRSPLGGEVILQTFQPEHYVIQTAAKHDYESFYQKELEYRRQLGYPPFTNLARLEYRHHDAERVERTAGEMAIQLRRWLEEESRQATRLVGPAPCFFARLGGLYRWQIILCGPEPASLLRGRNLGEWKIELNPPSLL
jgi:primosomal protein N' (replication factor Y)